MLLSGENLGRNEFRFCFYFLLGPFCLFSLFSFFCCDPAHSSLRLKIVCNKYVEIFYRFKSFFRFSASSWLWKLFEIVFFFQFDLSFC